MSQRPVPGLLVLGTLVALALGLLAPATAWAAPGGRVETITFGAHTCAPGWTAPNPGRARFRLENHSAALATVYLYRAVSGTIVATVSGLKPGATRRLTVRMVAGGAYAWSCDLKGHPIHTSEAQKVPLAATAGGPGPQGIPVQAAELRGPLFGYRGYVDQSLAALTTQLATLEQDTAAGALAAAEADWLTARLSWLEIGQDDGAYGIFGDLGRSIDGTAAGYAGGTADPHFTGFHRIEIDLWGAGDLARAAQDTATLQALVARLTPAAVVADTPGNNAGLATFVLRPHEILEDAERDTLTGQDDYGSGSGLAAVKADVAATRELLGLFAPLLRPRAGGLVSQARRELTALVSACSAATPGVPLAALPASQRELVDADTGAAVETLARVPDLLRIGTT